LARVSAPEIVQWVRAADWVFIRGSALLVVGLALGKFLGFAFSLVLAAAFTPGEYGAFQYTITLAMIMAIATQPFGQHVLARFISKHREDVHQLRQVLTNAWVVWVGLCGLTLLVSLPVLSIIGQLNAGVLAILAGTTLFYAYWGLARGFSAPGKLTAAYVGSNVIQLALAFLLIRVAAWRSTLPAELVYGLSYLLPLALLQIFWPFSLQIERTSIRCDMVREIIRFSQPVWLSHACYILYSSIEVLLLERFAGNQAVGVYVVAKTLAGVFLFVPTSIATLLMSKTAAAPLTARRRLLTTTLAWSLFINVGVLVLYLPSVEWFVRSVLGPAYVVPINVYLILALGMMMLGAESVITAMVVGMGRPRLETIMRVVVLLAALFAGLLLIPSYGTLGAAMTMSLGSLCGLLTYGVIAARKRLIL
jgi:O-antigen/teichoic acid export membrane protein